MQFCMSTLLLSEMSEAEVLCDAKRKHKSCPVLVDVGVSGYMLSFSTLISYLQFLLTPLHFVMYSAAHIHSPPYSLYAERISCARCGQFSTSGRLK